MSDRDLDSIQSLGAFRIASFGDAALELWASEFARPKLLTADVPHYTQLV